MSGLRSSFLTWLKQRKLQIDIAFGDRVVRGPEEIDFPTLLDLPGPHLRSYTRESAVAEKFEALVKLGMLNSRMKDFFDLWHLSKDFSFDARHSRQQLRLLLRPAVQRFQVKFL
jgi:hypothetical protein